MRIISGKYKRRTLISPPGDATRPIAERVKEALFNILRGHIEDEVVFDFFAGTGTIGLEAVSRGAKQAIFVERDREAVRRLRQNIEQLGCERETIVVSGDAVSPACLAQAPSPVHIATFDPPYELLRSEDGIDVLIAQMERVAEMLDHDGYLVLRTEWPFFDRDVPISSNLIGPETHIYKTMALHFYQRR